jgi:glycosyltransferase involved in cell wall biosynthesis
MHLLIIHQAFVSPSEPGGTRHFELGRHLLKLKHEVTIVASEINYLTGNAICKRWSLLTRQNLQGITILRAYTFPSVHRGFAWRVFSFLSFMVSSVMAGLKAGPVDLVMGTSPPIFQAASAWLVAAMRRRPLLLEIRDLWPEFAIDMGILKNPVLIRLSRCLEAFLYARADHIVVNSPAYRDYLTAKGVPTGKISLIANGVDPTLFDPQSTGAEIRKLLGLDGCFVVTYAGALGTANDIYTVLRAADRLRDQKNTRFLFVGDGKERQNLEKMAKDLQLDNTIFIGSVPKSKIPMILAASDACIAILMDIPMFRTTYPNKVFDYMAAGKPTILAIDGVIREVVEAAGGGVFVPPGNDEALAGAVANLASNQKLSKIQGLAARTYVEKNFNRATHAQEFADLVEALGGVAR